MAISPSHIPPDGSVVTMDSILRERCSKCGRFLPRHRRRATVNDQYVEDAEVATARLMSERRSKSRSRSRSRRSRRRTSKSGSRSRSRRSRRRTSSRGSRKRTSKRKRSKRSSRRSKRSRTKSVRFSRGSRRIPITTLHRRRKRKSERSKVSLSSKSMQRRLHPRGQLPHPTRPNTMPSVTVVLRSAESCASHVQGSTRKICQGATPSLTHL